MLRLTYRDLFIYQRVNLITLVGLTVYFFFILAIGSGIPVGFVAAASGSYGILMICMTGFAYDESYKSNKFNRALPISSLNIVLSRVISCACSSLMGFAISYIVALLFNLSARLSGAFAPVEIAISIGSVCIWIALGALITAIVLPPMYKFGSTKVRYPMMLLLMLVIVGVSVISSNETAKGIIETLAGNGILAAALALLLLAGSVWLSSRILTNKEV